MHMDGGRGGSLNRNPCAELQKFKRYYKINSTIASATLHLHALSRGSKTVFTTLFCKSTSSMCLQT